MFSSATVLLCLHTVRSVLVLTHTLNTHTYTHTHTCTHSHNWTPACWHVNWFSVCVVSSSSSLHRCQCEGSLCKGSAAVQSEVLWLHLEEMKGCTACPGTSSLRPRRSQTESEVPNVQPAEGGTRGHRLTRRKSWAVKRPQEGGNEERHRAKMSEEKVQQHHEID